MIRWTSAPVVRARASVSALASSYSARSPHATVSSIPLAPLSLSAGRRLRSASTRSPPVLSPRTGIVEAVPDNEERDSGSKHVPSSVKTAVAVLDYLRDVETKVLPSDDTDPVTHVAHVSDVHIRRNDRFEEYDHVFARLREGLRELKGRHRGSIAVIAGDVVHEKCNMHSNGADAAWEFFKSLSDIMPVVVIPGNHDGHVRSTSAKNTLYTLLRDRTYTHPIHLLLESGAYAYNNVLFGVSSILDGKFVRAKSIAAGKRDDVVKIALYHGPVGLGTRTSTGYTLPQAISTKAFEGYHLTLLGDIHKHQYLDKKQTMGYPGSLISQNFGETDDDHGWIEWDLATLKPTYHRVPNDYAHKSIDFIHGKVMLNDVEYNLQSIVKLLPKKASLRIVYSDDVLAVNKLERSLLDALPDLKIRKIPMLKESTVQSPSVLGESHRGDPKSDQELHSFVAKSFTSLSSEEVKKTIEALAEELKSIGDHNKLEASDWTPLMLKFNYLYGYGRDNVIDFTQLKEKGVVGLFAPNAYGKSSILDILSIAMFGKTTSEGTLHTTVINETQESFDTTVYFQTKTGIHGIERRGTRSNMSKVCRLYQLVSEEKASSLAEKEALQTEIFLEKLHYCVDKSQGFKDTQKAIGTLVGSYDGFRLTSMCLQNGASINSFISMRNVERKRMLMKLFELDVFDKVHLMVKPKLSTAQGYINQLCKSLVNLGDPEKTQAELNAELVAVTNTLESIESKIKKQESDLLVATASQCPVPASEEEVKGQLASLDTILLEAKMKAVSNELADVKKLETELQMKIDSLGLIAEKETILQAHELFKLKKKATLKKLQQEEDNVWHQLRPLHVVSYDGCMHYAVMKELKELEQQLPASSSTVKGLKFSDICECCKHNRLVLGQKETGLAIKYSELRETVDKMNQDKKLFEENQRTRECNQVMEMKLLNIQGEKKEVSESKDEHYDLLEHQEKKHADLMDRMLDTLKEDMRLSSEMHELESTMADVTKKRDELLRMIADIEHNHKMGKIVQEANMELDRLYTKRYSLSRTHTDLIKKLATVERDLALYHQHKQEYDKVAEEKAMLERLAYITSPDGYSLHMLKQYIPHMCQGVNSIIGLYMDRNVDMKLNGEKIDLFSVPQEIGNSPDCAISSFSGMEWFMVDVAIKIVLGKMARIPCSGLMFIDEGISVMDQDRMARIGDLLEFLCNHFRYTFVISHIDRVEDHVDTRLFITKEGKFSKINNTLKTCNSL